MPSLNSIFFISLFHTFGSNKAKQDQGNQPKVKPQNAGKKIRLSSLDILLRHYELSEDALTYLRATEAFGDDPIDDEKIAEFLEAARNLNKGMAEKGRKREAGPIPANNVTIEERALATHVNAHALRPGITLYDTAIQQVDALIAEYAPSDPDVVKARVKRMLDKTFRQARVQLDEIANEEGDTYKDLRGSAKNIADEHLGGKEPDHRRIYDSKIWLAAILAMVGVGECAINFNTFLAFLDDSIISYFFLTGILGAGLAVSAHYVGTYLPQRTKRDRIILIISAVVAVMCLGYINVTRLINGLENVPYVIAGISLWLFGMFFSYQNGKRSEYWKTRDAAEKANAISKQAKRLLTELDARKKDYIEDAVEDIMDNKEAAETTLTTLKARLETEKANFENEVEAIFQAGCETYREAYRSLREELARNSSHETWDESWEAPAPTLNDALNAKE